MAKKTGSRDKPEASAHAAPGSPARCETVKWLPDAQRPHLSSPPQALAATLPCCRSLVQIFPNEESTNIIPVPWMLASSRPVSRNRSSSYRFHFSQLAVVVLAPALARHSPMIRSASRRRRRRLCDSRDNAKQTRTSGLRRVMQGLRSGALLYSLGRALRSWMRRPRNFAAAL